MLTRGFGRFDAIGILVIVIGWSTMAALVNPIADFPLNDDWIYAGSAKSIVEHGYFWIPGPAIPNLLAQAYWGALFCLPFGFSFTALRVSSLVLGLVGLLALYGLLRRIGGAPRLALLGAVVVAVNPVWFNLANGFMTDVPFLCVTILSLLCLVCGEDSQSSVATMFGFALAFVAILIRQTGLFLLLGYAIAYPVRRGVRILTVVRGTVPLLLGAALHVGLQHWLSATGRLPDVVVSDPRVLIPPSIGAFVIASVRTTIIMLPYLGAFIFPFVVLTQPVTPPRVKPRRQQLASGAVISVTVLFLVWVICKHDGMPIMRNLIVSGGVGPLSLHYVARTHIDEPAISPLIAGLWLIATGIGGAGVGLLLDRVLRGGIAIWRAGGRAAWIYTLTGSAACTYWGAILLLTFWDHDPYDRYILYLLPMAMFAVTATPGMRIASDWRWLRTVATAGCVLVYGAFAVSGTHDFLAWNRARWLATDDLMTLDHIPPNQIDAGYEFDGWTHHDPRYTPRTATPYWWGDGSEPYVISEVPIPGYKEIRAYPVGRWLPTTFPTILVLAKTQQLL